MPSGDDPGLAIANEFAQVRVERVTTRNGVRLRISSGHDGSSVDLCPLQLEALASVDRTWLEDLVSAHASRSNPEWVTGSSDG